MCQICGDTVSCGGKNESHADMHTAYVEKWGVGGGSILQEIFGAHAGAVMQMRVHLAHVAKIAVRLVLFELLLFDAVFQTAGSESEHNVWLGCAACGLQV